MTRQQAETLVAARKALAAIMDERNSESWMGSTISGWAARAAVRADVARSAIVDLLICEDVYLHDENAAWALDAINPPEPEPTMAPMVHDYATGDALRAATTAELAASVEAAEHDGGTGVIADTDGTSIYVSSP